MRNNLRTRARRGGGRGVVRRRREAVSLVVPAKDVCGADCTTTRATRRSGDGVGVRKVRIDRLLARVTCAFLGTLGPGYTHGNRLQPRVPSPLSLPLPLSLCPSCARFHSPVRERDSE